LVVGKLVKIGFGFAAWEFRRHTLPVSHGCVSGSSVHNFKVAHYRKPRHQPLPPTKSHHYAHFQHFTPQFSNFR
jgi:hypothetical protein